MTSAWADLALILSPRMPETGPIQRRETTTLTDFDSVADALAARASYVAPREALAIPTVFACIRVIAHTVEQLPLRHTVGDRPEPLPEWIRVPERHTTFTTGQLLETFTVDLAVHGSAYAWVDREAGELVLRPVDPAAVQVSREHTRRGIIERTYSLDGQPVPLARYDPDYRTTRAGLLHMPYLSSTTDPAGMGPLRSRSSLRGYLSVEQFAAQVFDTGTWSGGRLESEQDLTAQTAKRYQDAWLLARRRGKVPVLGSGLRYVNDLIDPRDAQWVEARQFNAQEVARMFGVPMRYLGLPSGDSTTYATARDNDAFYLRSCISSYTSTISDGLSRLLGSGRGEADQARISFDYTAWLAVVAQLETTPVTPVEQP